MKKGARWFSLFLLACCGLVFAQAAPVRIGYLGSPGSDPARNALNLGMRDHGYEEGRNYRLEVRLVERNQAAVAAAVEDLLRSQVRLIVSQGTVAPAAHVAIRGRVPMVFGFSGDPVEAGMVQSMARPGGTSTGVSMLAFETVGKRLELLKELKPSARRVAILVRPGHAGARRETEVSVEAAGRLALQTVVVTMESDKDLPDALARIRDERVDGVVVFPDALMLSLAPRFAEFSRAERMLFVMGWKEFASAGLPATFGPSGAESYRTAARHVDRIIKGASPRDLPTEYPTRFYVAFNRKALAAIGITIPRALELRADEVVE